MLIIYVHFYNLEVFDLFDLPNHLYHVLRIIFLSIDLEHEGSSISQLDIYDKKLNQVNVPLYPS